MMLPKTVKQDCKYWDKCYQTNEHHLQKYNHPKKETKQAAVLTDDEKNQEQAAKRKMEQHEELESSTSKKPSIKVREEINTDELRKEVIKNASNARNFMKYYQESISQSVQHEYNDLLRTNEFIRHKFLVEMPADFYAFWQFVSELKKNSSAEETLQCLDKQFQLQLVGPFDFLAGRFHEAKIHEPGDYLRHWRFYFDPPEFQTIFVRRGTEIHYGYWRDSPQDKTKLLIARNDTSKGCEFEFIAGNAFEAFLYFLDKDFNSTPFTATAVSTTKKAIKLFLEKEGIELSQLDTLRKARNSKVVCRTFHRLGIVVPFDGETGYRPLMISEAELKKILKFFEHGDDGNEDMDDNIKTAVIEKLQPVATAASIALDECDFGTSLELGIDLFCSGRPELHMLAQSLLVPAYTLLSRPQFIAISKAHLEKRRRDKDLSIFELEK